MTTPVLVKNDENLGLKMSFYLPAENREKPPNPSETHVATESWPTTDYYVRQFRFFTVFRCVSVYEAVPVGRSVRP